MASVERIDDRSSVLLDDYRQLTDVQLRRRIEPAGGFFMAESAKVIARAVEAGYKPRSVITTQRWLPALQTMLSEVDTTIYLVDDEVLQDVAGYRVHRGALSAMQRRPLRSVAEVLNDARRVVVLEGIVDHTNVGAAFRSVAAVGFDVVLIDPTCADPLYRRSVRVSMGAVLTLPWTRAANWPVEVDELRRLGFTTLSLTPDESAASLDEVANELAVVPQSKIALILGAEGGGLSRDVMTASDRRVRIPMAAGIDSLNIAAATAVACYAFRLPAPDINRGD
ncbi:MAG TPA: RNA methyltransferase [Actinomycetes bacterium]|nr:RNA methyltransferase [Actinomycetes bacterium]